MTDFINLTVLHDFTVIYEKKRLKVLKWHHDGDLRQAHLETYSDN